MTWANRSLAMVFVVGVLVSIGCSSNANDNPRRSSGGGGNSAPLNISGGGGTVQKVRSAVDRTTARNELSQLAKFYQQYELLNGPPKSLKDLTDYMRTAQKIVKRIADKEYVVVIKGPQRGRRIIAYTKGTYGGRHLAAFSDTSVNLVDAAEIKKLSTK